MESQLGKDIVRVEAKDKVTGIAKYTNDFNDSPHAVCETFNK